VNKDATLVVVSIDTGTPEDRENDRLREYAQSSGPAGVGMAEERPEDKKEESLLDMASRYGKEFTGSADILYDRISKGESLFGESSTYRQGDPPLHIGNRRSPYILRGADEAGFTMMVPRSGLGPIDPSLLDEVNPIDDVHGRDPDMVLMDWMGDEDQVDSQHLSDLYPSDERIDYLSRRAGGETLIPIRPGSVRPESVRQMTDHIHEYNRFGGDAVAMELDRRDVEDSVRHAVGEHFDSHGREFTDADNDSMLQALMEANVEYAGIQDSKEGFAAVREDLGRNVEIKLVGRDGTKTVYSAYSPQIGRLRYSYDSATGVGRILGSE